MELTHPYYTISRNTLEKILDVLASHSSDYESIYETKEYPDVVEAKNDLEIELRDQE